MSNTSLPPQALLSQLAHGYLISAALTVAAQLRLADLLHPDPKPVDQLASSTESHPLNLYRVLRTLASLGIFAEQADGRFCNTPLSEVLRSDVPGSMRDAVLMIAHPAFWESAGHMLLTVRTGRDAFGQLHQKNFFENIAQDPQSAALFDRGMAGFSALEDGPIAGAYDFRSLSWVVDLGGGRGGFLTQVLQRNPHLRGTLYDLEHVTRGPSLLEQAGLLARCNVETGNFFQSVPAGADAYVLKRILHDWSDEECVSILRAVRAAMPAHGRVLAVDAVIPPGNAPDPVKLTDLLLMGASSGRERTEAEFRELLAAAGLRLTRVLPTPSLLSIIEGVPA